MDVVSITCLHGEKVFLQARDNLASALDKIQWFCTKGRFHNLTTSIF
jgi:hypothetical protein